MGMSTARIMKYLGLAAAFAGIGTRVYSWLIQAEAEGSPGGDDFTADELQKLGPMLEDAINTGLQGANIPVLVQITVIPLE